MRLVLCLAVTAALALVARGEPPIDLEFGPVVVDATPVDAQGSPQSPPCRRCAGVLLELTTLAANLTLEDVKATLASVCGDLPEDIQSECTDYSNEFSLPLFETITGKLAPSAACKMAQMCGGAATDAQASLSTSEAAHPTVKHLHGKHWHPFRAFRHFLHNKVHRHHGMASFLSHLFTRTEQPLHHWVHKHKNLFAMFKQANTDKALASFHAKQAEEKKDSESVSTMNV